MELSLYQLDAFSDAVFAGNPAAVCPLSAWPDDALMQAIAAENNLAETAFFVPAAPGEVYDFDIRWFTPTIEVDLCGHATLASAAVIFRHLGHAGDTVRFRARGGALVARYLDGDPNGRIALDFPAWPSDTVAVPPALAAALGAEPESCRLGNYLMAVFAQAVAVAALVPDMVALAAIDAPGIVATAPGTGGVDFVSRFFAPRLGVPEDPVTGSAHCQLVPYWAERRGRNALEARQISPRGGALACRLDGARVVMAGHVAEYMVGKIRV
ncbi:MAG: PhzF family phenazine biosynthesis protein [Alphaproteobacteria bacterium]